METNSNIANIKIHSMIHNLSCLSDLDVIIMTKFTVANND